MRCSECKEQAGAEQSDELKSGGMSAFLTSSIQPSLRLATPVVAIDHSVLLAEFSRVCAVHQEHRQQVISMMSLQGDEKKNKQSGGESSR